MKIENHMQRLKESLQKIEESIQGELTNSQMTIGFHTSAASANLLELYLHRNNFADYTFRFQHNWMKSKNIMREKLPYTFEHKAEIIDLLCAIEKNRDKLCYGKPQAEADVIEQIELFNQVRTLFKEMGVNDV